MVAWFPARAPVAGGKLAEAFVAETKPQDLKAMAETIRRVFPDALFSYAHLGRSAAEDRNGNEEERKHQRSNPSATARGKHGPA
jgi:hypothetical protein